MNDFRKENDLDGSQGDLRCLGHPQLPRQAQPWGVQQVPFIFIKMNIWNMFHERFSKTKRPGWVPRSSEGSRTPSATSTRSTMGSTASTTYVHQNEHLKHVSLTIFEKKMIWMSSKGIWGLSESDTLAWPTAPPKIFTALPYFKAIQSNRKMCFFGGLYLMHINSLPPQVKCEVGW